MTALSTFETGVLLAVLGNILVLNGKIIFEWLKGPRHKGGVCVSKHCEEHPTCLDRIKECEGNLVEVKEQAATFEERSVHILKSLEQGSEDFKGLKTDMSDIKSDIRVIATVIEKKEGSSLFQL